MQAVTPNPPKRNTMRLTLTLAALLIAGMPSTASADKPNVLFVAIDDLND